MVLNAPWRMVALRWFADYWTAPNGAGELKELALCKRLQTGMNDYKRKIDRLMVKGR